MYISIEGFSSRNCLKLKVMITEMAHEIRPICDFLSGSIRTNVPMDTVDVELTVWMVKGIYMYRKDHTMESMIFTPWSKKATPFPSLRHKIQAYQDDQRSERVLPWLNNGNNPFQFSAPPVTQTNPRKRAPGKIRASWSNKARYNPIKTKRPNTPETSVTNMDIMDKAKVPLQLKCAKGLGHLAHFATKMCDTKAKRGD